MTMTNRCEAEVDRIRVKLYEETKDLTKAEHTRRTSKLAQQLASRYGFTIRPYASMADRV